MFKFKNIMSCAFNGSKVTKYNFVRVNKSHKLSSGTKTKLSTHTRSGHVAAENLPKFVCQLMSKN